MSDGQARQVPTSWSGLPVSQLDDPDIARQTYWQVYGPAMLGLVDVENKLRGAWGMVDGVAEDDGVAVELTDVERLAVDE